MEGMTIFAVFSRSGPRGPFGVSASGGGSQCYLHCLGKSERRASHSCGGVWRQRSSFWYNFLRAQVLRRWRVRFQMIFLFAVHIPPGKSRNIIFESPPLAWLMMMSETNFWWPYRRLSITPKASHSRSCSWLWSAWRKGNWWVDG